VVAVSFEPYAATASIRNALITQSGDD